MEMREEWKIRRHIDTEQYSEGYRIVIRIGRTAEQTQQKA